MREVGHTGGEKGGVGEGGEEGGEGGGGGGELGMMIGKRRVAASAIVEHGMKVVRHRGARSIRTRARVVSLLPRGVEVRK